MTPPVHSGEPETPQTDRPMLEGVIENWLAPETEYEHALWHERIAPVLREAAALAPGAGLDVERWARAISATSGDRRPPSRGLMAQLRRDAAALIREYERLGATPDPRPETDPS